MNKSLYAIFTIIIVLLILVVILGLQLLGSKTQSPVQNDIACTQEAKICPDGTAVGRTGPNCEFAACPTDEEDIYCTADAYECPDGSFVGREAPDCEFAACPGASVNVDL